MYFHLHRNSRKETFYRVKILKSESYLVALCRNFKKWIFLLRKILKCRHFLIDWSRNSKSGYLYRVKLFKILQPPPPPPPPFVKLWLPFCKPSSLNFAEFGA